MWFYWEFFSSEVAEKCEECHSTPQELTEPDRKAGNREHDTKDVLIQCSDLGDGRRTRSGHLKEMEEHCERDCKGKKLSD